MVDTETSALHLDFSIYRISYCSADPTLQHVFTFIATNHNLTMECHAFLCQKKKIAQSATLTIAQAFNLAFEEWLRANKDRKKKREESRKKVESNDMKLENNTSDQYKSDLKDNAVAGIELVDDKDVLIDLSSLDDQDHDYSHNNHPKNKLNELDEKITEDMDLSFTQIAQRNTALPILSKLPANSSSLQFGSFICTDNLPYEDEPEMDFTTKNLSVNIWK